MAGAFRQEDIMWPFKDPKGEKPLMRLVYDLTANDTCFDPLSHLMGTAIPAIKIANHADPVEHWELVKALITNTRSATASAMC